MDETRQEAVRWVRRKRIFYLLLGIWVVLSVMWFTIDMLDGSDSYWFYWPMLGVGAGVAVTGLVLLGVGGLLGPEWERRQVENYVRRRGGDAGPTA